MCKPRVLVVEDSPTVSQVVEDILSKHGYPLSGIFSSAEEALTFAYTNPPDIVLMDISLQGAMDGIEAAGILTQDYGIPVIFLTSATDVESLDRALKSACSTYLLKPVQETELIINIEIVVHQNRIAKASEKEQRWREVILNGIIDAVLAEDDTGTIVYMNRSAATFLDTEVDFEGKRIDDYVTFYDMTGNPLLDLNTAEQHIECQMRTKSGRSRIILMKTHTLYDSVLASKVRVMTLSDITEEWFMQEKIRFLTFHDSLTGLYNRNFLEEELIRLNTERQLPISIIMADLNGLKIINDILGHVDGDLLLKACAYQLKEACRDEDIIARFGGDEFLVFLPATSKAAALHIVERIRAGSEKVVTPLGPMSIALGCYTKKSLSESVESAIMRADEEMYRDKSTQKKDYYQNCFNYVYGLLRTHPYEGHTFTDQVVCLLEEMILLRKDIHEKYRDIRHLGRIYDIGMICLPTHIYKSPNFRDGDWDQIHKHTEMSYKIINLNPKYSHIADAVLYHHERWDGQGYPYRLKGKDIPLLARMLSVVDAYCSMTRPRHYRDPMLPGEALKEVAKSAGTQFDPEVVDLFVTMMEIHIT